MGVSTRWHLRRIEKINKFCVRNSRKKLRFIQLTYRLMGEQCLMRDFFSLECRFSNCFRILLDNTCLKNVLTFKKNKYLPWSLAMPSLELTTKTPANIAFIGHIALFTCKIRISWLIDKKKNWQITKSRDGIKSSRFFYQIQSFVYFLELRGYFALGHIKQVPGIQVSSTDRKGRQLLKVSFDRPSRYYWGSTLAVLKFVYGNRVPGTHGKNIFEIRYVRRNWLFFRGTPLSELGSKNWKDSSLVISS